MTISKESWPPSPRIAELSYEQIRRIQRRYQLADSGLQLMMALGYQTLTPAEALAKRGGQKRNVILTDILEERLRAFHCIRFKGRQRPCPTATSARLCAG